MLVKFFDLSQQCFLIVSVTKPLFTRQEVAQVETSWKSTSQKNENARKKWGDFHMNVWLSYIG